MSRPRFHASSLVAIGAILLFAGCTTPGAGPEATPSAPLGTTPPTQPAPPKPAPPKSPASTPVAELKTATITGSEESSTMLDNLTAYVTAIDGQAVAAGRLGWNTPLTLKPGVRHLKVAFVRGKFSAQTDLRFNARAETSYQLKFATDAQLFGKNSYCDFWIEDTATGEKTITPLRTALAKQENN